MMHAKGIVRNIPPLEILSQDQVERIHRGALEVLETTGVEVESRRALEFYQKGGCIVELESHRVRFPSELVLHCIRQCPTSFRMRALDPRNDLILGGNVVYSGLFSGLRTVDLDTWETRIPTVQDNHDANKIADGLENVHGSPSYTPYCEFVDEPPVMFLPISTWSRLKYLSKVSRIGTTMGSHIWELQMAQALDVDIYGAMEGPPPLTWNKDATDCAIDCAEAGFPVEPAAGGAMGATYPATIAGALVISMAEVMSGLVLVQIVRPGNPVIVNCFGPPLNMRTGHLKFGAISISLYLASWNQIWRTMYGIPIMNGGIGASNSKSIDFQCAYEKSVGILLSAQSGANWINTVGGLTGELTYHPVLSVLENDVLGYIGRFLEGVIVDDETLAIDLIEETGPIPGNYLDKAHTRKWWKLEQFMPHVADILPYPQWLKSGKKSTLDMARERADYLLKTWESKLPPGKEKELDKILEECRQWYKKKGLI
ncbi:MAG: trimethylamine methyltransferase family protein [Spirochaetota bacterium]|nr:MAG: trimethylamine methyltransferase family protein [Spirochaetota bacterium]